MALLQQAKRRPLLAGSLATGAYLALSALWIVLSDQLLFSLDLDTALTQHISLLKGLGFVAIMGLLVGLLVFKMQSNFVNLTRAIERSSRDTVTGSGNRMAAIDGLQHALQNSRENDQQFAVLMVDVRQLTRINASLGRSGGDQALLQISRRIRQALREQDILARLESDKFLIIMPPPTDAEYAYGKAMSLSTLFERPIHVDGLEIMVQVTTSVVLGPTEKMTLESILDTAEASLTRAKMRGDSLAGSVGHSPISSRDALRFESELRLAGRKQEFHIYLQPQYELDSHELIGAEALVRWQHHRLGLLPPGQFIPIAETARIVPEITEAVVTEACRFCSALMRAGRPLLNVSFNLSAVDLSRPATVRMVRETLQSFDLDGAWLTAEITESALMQDPRMAARILQDLRQLGLQIAIDDFGTGYSSLNYLSRFPVDLLKVDRGFVTNVQNRPRSVALLRAINDMAHAMELRTLAEGVETESDLALLKRLRFDAGQGFLFGRPMTPDTFLGQCLNGAGSGWQSWQDQSGSRRDRSVGH